MSARRTRFLACLLTACSAEEAREAASPVDADAGVLDAHAPADAVADASCPDPPCPDARVFRIIDAAPASPHDAGPSGPDLGLRPIADDCSDLFAPRLLPTFEIEIDPAEWATIEDEFSRPAEREAAGLPVKPYHPVRLFRYGSEVVLDAMIRLKGNPRFSWRPPKMQFAISFRENDRHGRFHGLRKISLDAPWYDPSFLHERLATSFLREAGVPGCCTNNARLVVNGAFYGLFVNREHVDKEFLEREFDDPEGNLYKYGFELKTNEAENDVERRDRLWATDNLAAFAELVDRHAALRAWASEAMLPQLDGYWCCNHNYYLYDHPRRGFIFIPYDLDITFDGTPNVVGVRPDVDVFAFGGHKPTHFLLAMADRAWRDDFAAAVDELLPFYDAPELERRLDRWAAQIGPEVRRDPNLPFTYEDHLAAVTRMRAFFRPRAEFLEATSARANACRRGEPGPDLDNDGVDGCVDCNDLDREVHPGARERCNGEDDDCDGQIDNTEGCGECTEISVGESRFALCPGPQTWFDGHATCGRLEGRMAVPSAGEAASLLEPLETAGAFEGWWLGANDGDQEGRWIGPDGALVPPPVWAPGQPNGVGDQNCALLSPADGSWSDADCVDPYPVICVLPPAP